MSWWPLVVWPHLHLGMEKWLSSAASRESFHANAVRSASQCLRSVMVEWTVRTVLMRPAVVRVKLAHLSFHPCLVLWSCHRVSFFSSGTAPTKGVSGLHNQTTNNGRPGFHGDNTTGAPGLLTTRSQDGFPGMATPITPGPTTLQKITGTGKFVYMTS